MKKLSALLAAAAMFFAAGIQAQTGNTVGGAVSSATELLQKAGDARSSAKFQADCAAGMALDSCAKPVTPKGCPAGQHWTTMGSGIAHCVSDDPICGGGQVLAHDALGNPSCRTPVVTYQYDYRTVACPSPQIGSTDQTRTYTYTDGVLTNTGPWTTTASSCQDPAPPPPPPTPTCPNGASDYPTCTPPWTPPPTCWNGASNYPTCTFPTTPPPTAPTCSASDVVVSSTPCSAGMAGGPIEQHQTVSCPGSTVGSYSTGTCTPAVCANGAKNYPTCTFDPPPVQCPASYNWCDEQRGQSGDPRDDWWYWGTVTYEGPQCTQGGGQVGSVSGDVARGCPAGF